MSTPTPQNTKTPASPSDTTQPNPPAKAAHPKAPSHYAYHVREIGGKDSDKKGVWTQIGAAWLHRDGNGFNLKLDCVPIDGSIVLRAANEERGQ